MTEVRCGPGTTLTEKKEGGRVCEVCSVGTFSKGFNSMCRPCRTCLKVQRPCNAVHNTVCKDNMGSLWEACEMYLKENKLHLFFRDCSSTSHYQKKFKSGCNQGACNSENVRGHSPKSRHTKHIAVTETSAEDNMKDTNFESVELHDPRDLQHATNNLTIMLPVVCLCVIALVSILGLLYIQIRRRRRGYHTYCTVPKCPEKNKTQVSCDSEYVPLSVKEDNDPAVSYPDTDYEPVSPTMKGQNTSPGTRAQISCQDVPYVQIPIQSESLYASVESERREYYHERPPQPLPKRMVVYQHPRRSHRYIFTAPDAVYSQQGFSSTSDVDYAIDTTSYDCTPLSSLHSYNYLMHRHPDSEDISQLYIQSRGATASNPSKSNDSTSTVLVNEGTQTVNDCNTEAIGTQLCKETMIRPNESPISNVQDPLQRSSIEPFSMSSHPQEERIRQTPRLVKIKETVEIEQIYPNSAVYIQNQNSERYAVDIAVSTSTCGDISEPLKEKSTHGIHQRVGCCQISRPISYHSSNINVPCQNNTSSNLDNKLIYSTEKNVNAMEENPHSFKSENANIVPESHMEGHHSVECSSDKDMNPYCDITSSEHSCGDASCSSYNSSTYDVTKPVTFKKIRNMHLNKDTNLKANQEDTDMKNMNECNDNHMESNRGVAILGEATSSSLDAAHAVMENTVTSDIVVFRNSDVVTKGSSHLSQQNCKPENLHENLVKTEGTQTRQNCENMQTLFGQKWDVKKYFSHEAGQLTKSTTNMSLTVFENSLSEGETVLVGGRFTGNSQDVLPYLDAGWVVISPLAEFQMTYRKRWDKHVKIYIPYYTHNPKENMRVFYYHRTEKDDIEKGNVPQYDESKNQDMYYVKKPDHVMIHTLTFTLFHCACDHKFPLYLTSLVFTSYSKDESEAVVRLHIGDKLLGDKTVKAELRQKEKEENGTDLRKSVDIRLLQKQELNGDNRLVFKMDIPRNSHDQRLPCRDDITHNSEGGTITASPVWTNICHEQCPDQQERRFGELVECSCQCSEEQKRQYGATACSSSGHKCHVEIEWTYKCNLFPPPDQFLCNISITHEPPPGQEAERHGACQEGITWIRLKTPHSEFQLEKKSSNDEILGLRELPSDLKHHGSFSFHNDRK